MNYLENGVTREYVTAQFVNSSEFTEVCAAYGMQRGSIELDGYVNINPNLTMYVARCYREIHERDADTDGLEFWCQMIFTKERDAKFVAKSFIDSAEFTNRNLSNTEFVEVLYRTFMGRDSDPSGLAYWVGRLEGGTPRLQLVDEFANCFEFWEILKSFGLASRVVSVSVMTKSSVYDYGYTLVASDLIVTAVCEDGFTMTITDGFEIAQGETQEIPWVYVTYEGVQSEKKSFCIKGADGGNAVTSVAIAANADGYAYGYELIPQDLTVNVSYEDGSSEAVADGFVITQSGASVYVTYEGVKSNTITVSFSEPAVIDVVISAKASEYEDGYQLTSDDLNVTATFEDGSTKSIVGQYLYVIYQDGDSLYIKYKGLESNTITINYKSESVSVTVTSVSASLNKVAYLVNDVITVNDFTVTVTYSDGSSKAVADGVTLIDYSGDTAAAVSSITLNEYRNGNIYMKNGYSAAVVFDGVESNRVSIPWDYREGASLVTDMLALVNSARTAAGLSELHWDSDAESTVLTRANELVTSYSHIRPDGTTVDALYAKALGENINYGGYRDASGVQSAFDSWMNSAGHKALILMDLPFATGFSCAKYVTADGYAYWVMVVTSN